MATLPRQLNFANILFRRGTFVRHIAITVMLIVLISTLPLGSLAFATERSPQHGRGEPGLTGWDSEALRSLVAYARAQKTTGLLIIQNKRVIVEHNWPLPPDAADFATNFTHGKSADGALLEDIASAQKSFVAVLVAIAIDKGLLDISKPVNSYIDTGWSKTTTDREGAISIRHLMEMTSGLNEYLADEAAPGEKFLYNTAAYAMLIKILEATSKQTFAELTRDWLTEPLTMSDTRWHKRPTTLGNSVGYQGVGNPHGLVTSPRDLAKFGQLVLDRGRAPTGKRVVSQKQLDSLFERSKSNPSYGRLWWLNGGAYTLRRDIRYETQVIASAPADLIGAFGFHNRMLCVVPSLNLIVVRTGQAAPDPEFGEVFWSHLMAANIPVPGSHK